MLQPQQYGRVEDWNAHFDLLQRFFSHPDYIRVTGQPVFLILRAGKVPDLPEMLRHWRRRARGAGWPGLHLVAMLGAVPDTWAWLNEFDAACEFVPNHLLPFGLDGVRVNGVTVVSAEESWRRALEVPRSHPVQYRGALAGWDNSPRHRHGGGLVFTHPWPAGFRRFLDEQLRRLREDQALPEPFLFINAWNEWGEGAHLEPDLRWGYGYLEALRDALAGRPAEAAAAAAAPAQDEPAGLPRPPARHAASTLRLTMPANYGEQHPGGGGATAHGGRAAGLADDRGARPRPRPESRSGHRERLSGRQPDPDQPLPGRRAS